MGLMDEIEKNASVVKYDPSKPFTIDDLVAVARIPMQPQKPMTEILIDTMNQMCKTEEEKKQFMDAYMKGIEQFCKSTGLVD